MRDSVPFILVVFSFVSIFLYLRLVVVDPGVGVRDDFFFVCRYLAIVLMSFAVPTGIPHVNSKQSF